jgi:hypothetical protein
MPIEEDPPAVTEPAHTAASSYPSAGSLRAGVRGLITPADILKVVTDLEQEAKSPQLPIYETYVVDLLSILGMVVGVFRPDLRNEISTIPQTAILIIAMAALFAINWVRLHERTAVKKTAMGLAVSTRSSLLQ